MGEKEYTKPLPEITDENRPFWEGCKQNELRMQKCTSCGHIRYPINDYCPECLSDQYEWAKLSGRGTVFSYVVFHQLYNKAFKDDIPYNAALIQLEEGPRMISNIVGIPNEEIRCDMPVEVVFDPVTDEVTIPRFRPVTG